MAQARFGLVTRRSTSARSDGVLFFLKKLLTTKRSGGSVFFMNTTTFEIIDSPSNPAGIRAALKDKTNFYDIPEMAEARKIWPAIQLTTRHETSGCYYGHTTYGIYIPELNLTVAANCIVPREAWKCAMNHARYRELAAPFPGGEERDTFSSKKKV